jgi:predicted nucleic acid-binding Zn ribbon protein
VEALPNVLSRLFKRLGLEDELQGWRAVEDWARVVGPRVARHTRAIGFEQGVLRVEVEGSAWMHELGYLKQELIKAVNRELGTDRVRDVRFVVPRKGVLR